MMEMYKHVPFSSPRSVRVLTLHAAADPTAVISCNLTEVSLDDRPRYIALSYTWGGEALIDPVYCAGAVLKTTRNCFDALKQLRERDTPIVLWIDSLCIDQTSPTERSQQVGMMGEIYKNARSIVAWLGISDDRMNNAMMLIEHLTTAVDVKGAVDRLQHTTKTLAQDQIGSFFARAWFSRLWTLQEVCLPEIQNVIIQSGEKALPFALVLRAVDALGSGGYQFGGYKEAMQLQYYLTGMISAERDPSIRKTFSSIGDGTLVKPHASHILGYARRKGAKCDKDRVFALLSILKELEYKTFEPDYDISVEEVYRKSAIMVIENDRDLLILFQVPSDNRKPGLCSWVPDWVDPGYQDTDLGAAIERGQFAAAGPSHSSWSFSSDHLCLNLYGKFLDTITHRSSAISMMRGKELLTAHSTAMNEGVAYDGPGLAAATTILQETNKAIEVLKSWVEIASRYSRYPTGEPIKTALQRTMTYDTPQENGLQSIEVFDTWYNIMTADELAIGAMALGIVRTGGGLAPKWVKDAYLRKRMQRVPEDKRILRALMLDDRVFRYNAIAATFSKGKCMFTTGGGYMGTAPDLVQVGDRISLVAGLSMPLILRPVGGGHQLITHAYVHGIMYGEAWPEKSAELRHITLI